MRILQRRFVRFAVAAGKLVFRRKTRLVGEFGTVIVLAIILLGHAAARADQNTPINRDAFINIARSCFNDGIRTDVADYKRSPSTEAYLAERLFSVLGRSASELTRAAAEIFCKGDLIPTYKAAYAAVVAAANEDPDDPILAKLGFLRIEHKNKFIQWTNNLFLRHNTTGHSELTEMALDALPSELQLGKWARRLVVRASQSPDLYRWSQERYHAHSVLDELSKRASAIKKSWQKFVMLVSQIMLASVEQVQNGDFASALFWMGAGCHPLQDLVYHRGMTLRQHAGLSYAVENRDPDLPTGALFRQRVDEGVSYCKFFVQNVLIRAGERARQLREWQPGENFDFTKLAEEKFRGEPDMTVGALYDYRKLADPYKLGERPLAELASGNGLIEWEVKAVMLAIKDRIRKIQ